MDNEIRKFGDIIGSKIDGYGLTFYTPSELRSSAAVHVHELVTFDSFGLPRANGLHDGRLGASLAGEVCPTCGGTGDGCVGHLGYLELPVPVFHPLTFSLLKRFLHTVCFACSSSVVGPFTLDAFHDVLIALAAGDVTTATAKFAFLSSFTANSFRKLGARLLEYKPDMYRYREEVDGVLAGGASSGLSLGGDGAAEADEEVDSHVQFLRDLPGFTSVQLDRAGRRSLRFTTGALELHQQVCSLYLEFSRNVARCGYCKELKCGWAVNGKSSSRLFRVVSATATAAASGSLSNEAASAWSSFKHRKGGKAKRQDADELAEAGGSPSDSSESEDSDDDLFGDDEGSRRRQRSDSPSDADSDDESAPRRGKGRDDVDGDADADASVADDEMDLDPEDDGGSSSNRLLNPKTPPAKRAKKEPKRVQASGLLLPDDDVFTMPLTEMLSAKNEESLLEASAMDTTLDPADSSASSKRPPAPPSLHYASPLEVELRFNAHWGWHHAFLSHYFVESDYPTPLPMSEEEEAGGRAPGSAILVGDQTLSSFRPGSQGVCFRFDEDGPLIKRFFVKVLGVPAAQFRTVRELDGAQAVVVHMHTKMLTDILEVSHKLTGSISKASGAVNREVISTWVLLQEHVNSLMNEPNARLYPDTANSIKNLIEKKTGLVRSNMMGKRVNFAGRTVISPDPFLEPDEIGIPLQIAKNVTFPEPVNDLNLDRLRKAIIVGSTEAELLAGAEGAIGYMDEDGRETRTYALDRKGREAAASQLALRGEKGRAKVVMRHLRDGDYVLVNRQPTLHRTSMMAHRVRVLRSDDRVLRMHYASCSGYNADFDGDEMNVHVPQSEAGRAEAKVLVSANTQYLLPKDGMPIRGLIQDHVVMGVILTMRDTVLDRAEVQRLLWSALQPVMSKRTARVTLPEPAYLRPRELFSGKQVVSAVLTAVLDGCAPLNYEGKCRVSLLGVEERRMIIVQNDVCTGILDKAHIGSSARGLVHAVHELYGYERAGDLLACLSRLLTAYLEVTAFTCGIDDMILNDDVDVQRRDLLLDAEMSAVEATQSVLEEYGHPTPSLGDDKAEQRRVGLDPDSKTSSEIRDTMLLARAQPNGDDFLAMLDGEAQMATGNAGATVVSACLAPATSDFRGGLQKSYATNNMSLMTSSGAKGSQVNQSQISALLGQQALEGRRPKLTNTGRTLPCFPKGDARATAGGFIGSRFLTGVRPAEFFFHCAAGREGLVDTAVKTARSGYLQRCLVKNLEDLSVNYDYSVRASDGTVVQPVFGADMVAPEKSAYLREFDFFAANFAVIKEEFRRAVECGVSEEVGAEDASKAWLGELEAYCAANPSGLLRDGDQGRPGAPTPDEFATVMRAKFSESRAAPGDACGVLAAQSIGEPSTQMTLNTFHLAGRGEGNVTLGIPRLVELLRVSSKNPKTPVMRVAMRDPKSADDANAAAAYLRRYTIADVVDWVQVTQRGLTDGTVGYTIDLHLGGVLKTTGESTDAERKLNTWLANRLLRRLNLLSSDNLTQHMDKLYVKLLRKAAGSKAVPQARPLFVDDRGGASSSNRSGGGGLTASSSSAKDPATDDESGSSGSSGSSSSSGSSGSDDESSSSSDDSDGGKRKRGGGAAGASPAKRAKVVEEDEAVASTDESGETRVPLGTIAGARWSVMYGVSYNLSESRVTLQARLPPRTADTVLMDVLTKEVLERVEFHSVAGVTSASPAYDENADEYYVAAGGMALDSLMLTSPDTIDFDRSTSNAVHSVQASLGVEAARATLIAEVVRVFGAYGININERHLSLLADYMTLSGCPRGLNRYTMASNASPILRASFEQTGTRLTESALYQDFEQMQASSGSIALGRPVRVGTGMFDVRVPLFEPQEVNEWHDC